MSVVSERRAHRRDHIAQVVVLLLAIGAGVVAASTGDPIESDANVESPDADPASSPDVPAGG